MRPHARYDNDPTDALKMEALASMRALTCGLDEGANAARAPDGMRQHADTADAARRQRRCAHLCCAGMHASGTTVLAQALHIPCTPAWQCCSILSLQRTQERHVCAAATDLGLGICYVVVMPACAFTVLRRRSTRCERSVVQARLVSHASRDLGRLPARVATAPSHA